jgi:dimethylaniline monooxygenase (N-oxide forming)
VAAKLLREHGYDAIVYEAGAEVGGTFANKTYEGGRLVSSKFLTPFSDLRMLDLPASENHPSVPTYLAYLRAYCDKFNLWPAINFGHRVEHVRPLGGDDDGYAVRAVDSEGREFERTFDLVAVCSGLHNVPRVPTIPGVESFRGELFHSSAYKVKAQLAGRRVVIVGTGETAMDVVYHACLVGAAVTLSVRRGFLSVPHEGWGGVPLDSESRPRAVAAAGFGKERGSRERGRERAGGRVRESERERPERERTI